MIRSEINYLLNGICLVERLKVAIVHYKMKHFTTEEV